MSTPCPPAADLGEPLTTTDAEPLVITVLGAVTPSGDQLLERFDVVLGGVRNGADEWPSSNLVETLGDPSRGELRPGIGVGHKPDEPMSTAADPNDDLIDESDDDLRQWVRSR